jgi:hypothetical protein
VSGITDPGHERYGEAAEVRALIDADPDMRRIYDTAVGLEGMVRGARLLALDPRFRVTTSPALMGELKALFGSGCLR